ncbi:MAG: bifunctional adenosylcobinamide kinase/adenosylcobinamide-phosphate guanylyltransferase [Deltaproteobacteria bacterium]|nr:bifunctional adenosylcobinamide kinase/adenosylcobinamide-phosphate guanylyltransferase [Deltaproteobacteria bacterium]
MNFILSGEFRLALILGGARSGKSRLALRLAEARSAPRLFLATAEPGDAEMAARIDKHRQDRGTDWHTWEEPLELAAAIDRAQGSYRVILVDCLTLWLSNILMGEPSAADLEKACGEVVEAAGRTVTPLILVSNEVGWGIVPDNPLARQFRDAAGGLHQRLAAKADLVLLCVAGLPLMLKSPPKGE